MSPFGLFLPADGSVGAIHARVSRPVGGRLMDRIVDIFARLPDGSPIWVEAVESLSWARARVRELSKTAPSDYFIYSERNGRIEREDHPVAL